MKIGTTEIIAHVALMRDISENLVNQDDGARDRMTGEEKKFKEQEFKGLLTATFSLLGGLLCDLNRTADALESISATLADMKENQDKHAAARTVMARD